MLNPLENRYFSSDWLYNNSLRHTLTETVKGHTITIETPQRRIYNIDITIRGNMHDVTVDREIDGNQKSSYFVGITQDMIEAVVAVTILQDNTKTK